MARTDRDLNRQLRRLDRRMKRAKKRDNPQRTARLARKHDRLTGYLALPIDERPKRVPISTALVQGALDAALLVLSATPAGPVLQGAKLGLTALAKVKSSVASQDVEGTIDGLADAVRTELASRGVHLDEDDEALAAMLDVLEDKLDRDA